MYYSEGSLGVGRSLSTSSVVFIAYRFSILTILRE